MRTNRRSLLVGLVALVAMSACSSGGGPQGSPSPTPTPSPSPSPTPTASPSAPHATGRCEDGWTTPQTGSTQYETPLHVIERATGRPGPFAVQAMRYFTGPESPPSTQGYLAVVKRWYVKAVETSDPSFRARFLVEKREFGAGLAAVAPFDTRGFRSPDWVGFQLDTTQASPSPYPGLPGAWSGDPYDFVTGGRGLRFPGLPTEVAGCLRGT